MTAQHSNHPAILHGTPSFLSTETYGLCIIGLAAALYSAMGAFVKLVTQSGIPSTELVFIRAIFQIVLVVTAMCWFHEIIPSSSDDHEKEDDTVKNALLVPEVEATKIAPPQEPRLLVFAPLGNSYNGPIVVARGAAGGCGFLLFFYTMSVLPLGDAVALMSLSPVVTVWASAAFLAEPVRGVHVVAAFTTVLGSFLIARPDFLFGSPSNQPQQQSMSSSSTSSHVYHSSGYITAALGTCTQACVFLLMRKAGKCGVHTLQLLFSWCVFGILFSILLGVVLPLGKGGWALPRKETWPFIAGCCGFGAVAHFCLNFAGRHSNPGLASIVRSSGIVWAYVLQIVLFGQVPTPLTCVGVGLIFVALLLVSLQKLMDTQEVTNGRGYATCVAAEQSNLIDDKAQKTTKYVDIKSEGVEPDASK